MGVKSCLKERFVSVRMGRCVRLCVIEDRNRCVMSVYVVLLDALTFGVLQSSLPNSETTFKSSKEVKK